MIKNNTWTANVVTLFPEMFPGSLSYSLTGKALKNNLWNLKTYNLRKFANGKRKTVDGPSAGGGAGQILKAIRICNLAYQAPTYPRQLGGLGLLRTAMVNS